MYSDNTILIKTRAGQSYSQTALICTHFDQLVYFHMEAKSFTLCSPRACNSRQTCSSDKTAYVVFLTIVEGPFQPVTTMSVIILSFGI